MTRWLVRLFFRRRFARPNYKNIESLELALCGPDFLRDVYDANRETGFDMRPGAVWRVSGHDDLALAQLAARGMLRSGAACSISGFTS